MARSLRGRAMVRPRRANVAVLLIALLLRSSFLLGAVLFPILLLLCWSVAALRQLCSAVWRPRLKNRPGECEDRWTRRDRVKRLRRLWKKYRHHERRNPLEKDPVPGIIAAVVAFVYIGMALCAVALLAAALLLLVFFMAYLCLGCVGIVLGREKCWRVCCALVPVLIDLRIMWGAWCGNTAAVFTLVFRAFASRR